MDFCLKEFHMFDFTEYDKTVRALRVLQDIKANAKVNGVSRDDIKYALEAAEIFKLPDRYPVNAFTAEPSKTNLNVALESLSKGEQIGYSILTGVIVGLLVKIISFFFTGGGSGGSAPYIAKQNNVLEQYENLKKIAELQKERNDEIQATETKRAALRKVLGDVDVSEYMIQHPYTRIAFETLCSHSAKFRKCTAYLGEDHKRENLRMVYVYILAEMNDALAEMIKMADAIKEWAYARKRGGDRERVIEDQIKIPGPIFDKFIRTGVPKVNQWLAANGLVGSGLLIDVPEPETYTGLPIPPEDRAFFTLVEVFRFMHRLESENTGIMFAESADFLDRLITDREKLLNRVVSSKILDDWKPLPVANEKDYDPMNQAVSLNERFSKSYDRKEWNVLFSAPDKKGYSSDEEADWFVGESFQVTQIYFDASQQMYKESAILLKLSNDIISGLHDALRIVEKYHKELQSSSKDKKDDDK